MSWEPGIDPEEREKAFLEREGNVSRALRMELKNMDVPRASGTYLKRDRCAKRHQG